VINRRTFLTSLALVAVLTSTVLAQPGSRGRQLQRDADRGAGPEMRLERLTERLDLSEQQQQAIEAIRDDARKAGRELHKQLARLQNQREGEMLADKPSEKALVSLTEQIGAIKSQLQVHRLKTRLAVRDQLTEEQRDQMTMLEHRRGGRGGRFMCDGDGRRGSADDGPERRGGRRQR